MAKYKGKSAVIYRPIASVYERFSDLSVLEEVLRTVLMHLRWQR